MSKIVSMMDVLTVEVESDRNLSAYNSMYLLLTVTSFSLLAFKDFTALSKIGYILAISPKKSNKNARSI